MIRWKIQLFFRLLLKILYIQIFIRNKAFSQGIFRSKLLSKLFRSTGSKVDLQKFWKRSRNLLTVSGKVLLGRRRTEDNSGTVEINLKKRIYFWNFKFYWWKIYISNGTNNLTVWHIYLTLKYFDVFGQGSTPDPLFKVRGLTGIEQLDFPSHLSRTTEKDYEKSIKFSKMIAFLEPYLPL